MRIIDLIKYGKGAIGMNKDNTFHTLPGEADYRTIDKRLYPIMYIIKRV